MSGRITIDGLSTSLREYINNLGLTEEQVQQLITTFENEKIGDVSTLTTENKTVVAAINELFQNANNGKELIATAIGEPLNSSDTFSAMSTGINSLLSTFKTNMMNNGVVVEGNDKFKALIDKIATLADSEGKGIQMTNGTFSYSHPIENTYGELETTTVNTGLNFNPTLIIVNCTLTTDSYPYTILTNGYINNLETFTYKTGTIDRPNLDIYIDNISKESFNLNVSTTVYCGVRCTKWYAIGVGEDPTLRDSLASILQDEGVVVVPEDKLANLITKTDEEFDRKNNKAENTRSTLAGLMKDGGYEITGDEDIDRLLELLTISGIALNEIKQIASGYDYIFILKTDGSVWGCGLNTNGELGLGDNNNKTTFTQVTTNINNDVKQIACGYYHTFILKNDGSIWACGYNNYGQLGLGNTTNKTTLTKVTTNINNDVKQVVCGYMHTFIIKNDGSLWACGVNNCGVLGTGDSGNNYTTFTQVTTNINNDVKQIACGNGHTFILKNDGSLWCCGYNNYGQLGLGNNTSDRHLFTQVTTNINNDVKEVVCGYDYTFIIKNDGSLWSCGNNNYGQLGLGDTTNKTTFTKVTTNINNDVKQVDCGYYHTFILKNDGGIWSCGYNSNGQLGLGNTTNKTTFTKVTTNINNDVKEVICGCDHNTFILKNDGRLWACGYNIRGQLGLGDTTDKTTFTQIPRGLY